MKYNVAGTTPDERGGDMLEIEAASKEEASKLFLDVHPGWVVTEIYPA